MAKKIQLIEITEDEFFEGITASFVSALQKLQPPTSSTGNAGDQRLTMKALCVELDLSRTRINQMIRSGILKPERLPGSRRLYFKRSQIFAAMEKNGRKK